VNRRQLARFAHETGLGTLVIASSSQNFTLKDNPNVFGEALEAYIGALYLDYGEEGERLVREFVTNLIDAKMTDITESWEVSSIINIK
jgi:dsRNA-specific ribonuclease